MNATSEMGQCPACELEIPVGSACTERGCSKRGYHGIPKDDATALDPRNSDSAIGTMVDEYLIVGLLGAGGFGKVFRALQMPIRMPTALKLMHSHMKEEAHFEVLLRKFQGEAQALATLSHPNIVRLLKYGLHMGNPYLVMEMVEGARTLKKEISQRAIRGADLAPGETFHILRQCADAMEAAHTRKIVHRDIKPENIMLQEVAGNANFVRILDFGLAKFVAESSETSVAMGTPVYMAPEQLTRKNIGPWTDLYALGVVAYELLTGRRPFAGRTHQEIIARKLDPGFDPVAQLSDMKLPETLKVFLKRALHRDPAERYRSASQFRTALEEVTTALSLEEQKTLLTADLTGLLDSGDLSLLDTKRKRRERERRNIEDPAPQREVLTATEAGATTLPPRIQVKEESLVADSTIPAGNTSLTANAPSGNSTKIAIYASLAGILFIGAAVTIGLTMNKKSGDKEEVAAVTQGEDTGSAGAPDAIEVGRDGVGADLDASSTGSDADPGTGDVVRDPQGLSPIALVVVPEGTYEIGCKGADCNEYQRPHERINLGRPYKLMMHEVTVNQYRECVEKGDCARNGSGPGCLALDKGNEPINCVSYKDAKRFCEWRKLRLPTDAEWELAARGKTLQPYPWGASAPTCDLTVMKGCGSAGAHSVGFRTGDVSWCGVRDLAGNVTEWTSSLNENGHAYIRGANFLMDSKTFYDCTIRQPERTSLKRRDIGFRCAKSQD